MGAQGGIEKRSGLSSHYGAATSSPGVASVTVASKHSRQNPGEYKKLNTEQDVAVDNPVARADTCAGPRKPEGGMWRPGTDPQRGQNVLRDASDGAQMRR